MPAKKGIKLKIKERVPKIKIPTKEVTRYSVWITYNKDTKKVSSTVRINYSGGRPEDILHVSAAEASYIVDILRNEKPVRIELGNQGLIVLAAGYEAGGEPVGEGE